MDGENNFAVPGDFPTAPPPPSEVKVRTMRSDLASMAKSGGGLPKFESVKVEGGSVARVPVILTKPAASSTGTTAPTIAQPAKKSNVMPVILVIILIAIVAVGGWFIYTNYIAGKLGSQSSQAPTTPPSTQAQSNQIVVPTTTPAQTPSNNETSSVPILKLGQ